MRLVLLSISLIVNKTHEKTKINSIALDCLLVLFDFPALSVALSPEPIPIEDRNL